MAIQARPFSSDQTQQGVYQQAPAASTLPAPGLLVTKVRPRQLPQPPATKTRAAKQPPILTPDLIETYNKTFGTYKEALHPEIETQFQAVERLGGLAPLNDGENVNIPEARMALLQLLQLREEDYKKRALKDITKILKNATLKETAANADGAEDETPTDPTTHDILEFAPQFVRAIDFSQATLNVQTSGAESLSQLVETILDLMRNGQIGSISTSLKNDLQTITTILDNLNRSDDPAISFYAKYALQGINILTTDAQNLFTLLEILQKVSTDALATFAAVQSANPVEVTAASNQLVLDIAAGVKQIHLLQADWFSAIQDLNAVYKKVMQGKASIKAYLTLVDQQYQKHNWRFFYQAVLHLSDVCVTSSTPEQKTTAWNGFEVQHSDGSTRKISGLKDIHLARLKKYWTFSPFVHFKLPHRKNPNVAIKRVMTRSLAVLQKRGEGTMKDEARTQLQFMQNPLHLAPL